MPSFIVSRPPTYPRPSEPYILDTQHWQAQNLRVCLPFGSSSRARDLIRGGQVDLIAGGGSPSQTFDPRIGRGWRRDGTQTSTNLADTRAYATTALTVTAVVSAFATTSLMTFFARSLNTVAAGMWVFGLDSAAAWRFTTFENVQRNAVGSAVTTNQITFLVGTLGPITGSANQFIYVNSPVSSGNAATGTAMASITQDYGIGRRTDAGVAFNGAIYDLAAYDVEWSATQVSQWLQNPGAKYWKPRQVTHFNIAAVGQPAYRRAGLVRHFSSLAPIGIEGVRVN